ncbi:hypothetical protein B9Z19DRAFT_1097198 [Tuber borchii]|uniref:ACB domain-containing protein n=1 Tax=Tuber borchii TaxID=42251 RepID=A0A2T6ZAE7_TUBBO|nr:hypothetical protein B9Z19DRAFT_1097198 [Tuber borchii]
MTYTPTPAFLTAKANVDDLKETKGHDLMLLAYTLFKHTTIGDTQGTRPGMFSPKERKKFDAWGFTDGMTQEKTDELYINCSNHLVRDEPLVEENQALLKKIRELLGME